MYIFTSILVYNVCMCICVYTFLIQYQVTALHLASISGYYHLAQLLLEKGAELNARIDVSIIIHVRIYIRIYLNRGVMKNEKKHAHNVTL